MASAQTCVSDYVLPEKQEKKGKKYKTKQNTKTNTENYRQISAWNTHIEKNERVFVFPLQYHTDLEGEKQSNSNIVGYKITSKHQQRIKNRRKHKQTNKKHHKFVSFNKMLEVKYRGKGEVHPIFAAPRTCRSDKVPFNSHARLPKYDTGLAQSSPNVTFAIWCMFLIPPLKRCYFAG